LSLNFNQEYIYADKRLERPDRIGSECSMTDVCQPLTAKNFYYQLFLFVICDL